MWCDMGGLWQVSWHLGDKGIVKRMWVGDLDIAGCRLRTCGPLVRVCILVLIVVLGRRGYGSQDAALGVLALCAQWLESVQELFPGTGESGVEHALAGHYTHACCSGRAQQHMGGHDAAGAQALSLLVGFGARACGSDGRAEVVAPWRGLAAMFLSPPDAWGLAVLLLRGQCYTTPEPR